MAFAGCNACSRRHKRPVNSKCDYLKAAVNKCAELGISSPEYVQFIPELLLEDTDPASVKLVKPSVPVATSTPGRAEVPSGPDVNNELLQELVSENARSRKLLESSQNQVERMMAQLLDLKLTSQNESRPPVTSDGATTTHSILSGSVPVTTAYTSSSISHAPANMNTAQVGFPDSFLQRSRLGRGDCQLKAVQLQQR